MWYVYHSQSWVVKMALFCPHYKHSNWLVVSTPLKNISQIGSSSQLLGKIKNVPNHQPGKVGTGLKPTRLNRLLRRQLIFSRSRAKDARGHPRGAGGAQGRSGGEATMIWMASKWLKSQ